MRGVCIAQVRNKVYTYTHGKWCVFSKPLFDSLVKCLVVSPFVEKSFIVGYLPSYCFVSSPCVQHSVFICRADPHGSG